MIPGPDSPASPGGASPCYSSTTSGEEIAWKSNQVGTCLLTSSIKQALIGYDLDLLSSWASNLTQKRLVRKEAKKHVVRISTSIPPSHSLKRLVRKEAKKHIHYMELQHLVTAGVNCLVNLDGMTGWWLLCPCTLEEAISVLEGMGFLINNGILALP
ncbi:hypothetical protein E2C01_011831 [Portunus trituberculatus]|uniref:Uncharacterized protein n=1 Tax=Portunus trituberculatus TaxID=210409 RepID=A0A5B7DC09_PORTR|nr:hypothetical protein [Portunus trituberculatus]